MNPVAPKEDDATAIALSEGVIKDWNDEAAFNPPSKAN
jgi:hypothetical protein